MAGPIARSGLIDEPPGLVARDKSFYSATLAAALTLDETYPNCLKLDPGGAHRDVTLPAEATSTGVTFRIVNAADAAENLVVKDDGASTIATINQDEQGEFYCDGSTWSLICITAIALS